MYKVPPRTCQSPIPPSNVQAFPGTLYRSGLGVGMSPAIKKTPFTVYRPAIGSVKVKCCGPKNYGKV